MHLVDLFVLNFYFDLVTLFYFLKWNSYFSTCKNLPNFSYHFWKHESVFLHILHQFSVPSNLTHLYFFSSNVTYFDQKEPIKVQIWDFWVFGLKFIKFSCQFWNDKSIPVRNFALFFLVMRHNSSVNFKLLHFLLG